MSIFQELRALVFLRRIARALEMIALAQAELAEIAAAQHAARTVKKKPRVTEFGSFDVEDANKRWAKEQEALEFGQIPEDAT